MAKSEALDLALTSQLQRRQDQESCERRIAPGRVCLVTASIACYNTLVIFLIDGSS